MWSSTASTKWKKEIIGLHWHVISKNTWVHEQSHTGWGSEAAVLGQVFLHFIILSTESAHSFSVLLIHLLLQTRLLLQELLPVLLPPLHTQLKMCALITHTHINTSYLCQLLIISCHKNLFAIDHYKYSRYVCNIATAHYIVYNAFHV